MCSLGYQNDTGEQDGADKSVLSPRRVLSNVSSSLSPELLVLSLLQISNSAHASTEDAELKEVLSENRSPTRETRRELFEASSMTSSGIEPFFPWSPEDTPRKTPKRRSILLSKNKDVIDQYRASFDGSDSLPPVLNASKAMVDALMQEGELVAQLQHDLKQEKILRSSIQSELEGILSALVQLSDGVADLESNMPSARETASDKRTLNKLRKMLAQHEQLFQLLCSHVETKQVLEYLNQTGLKDSKVSRHSIDIMTTVSEDEESSEDKELGQNLFLVVKLRQVQAALSQLTYQLTLEMQELDAARSEAEALRRTADSCWVREQAAMKRIEELEVKRIGECQQA